MDFINNYVSTPHLNLNILKKWIFEVNARQNTVQNDIGPWTILSTDQNE